MLRDKGGHHSSVDQVSNLSIILSKILIFTIEFTSWPYVIFTLLNRKIIKNFIKQTLIFRTRPT